MDEGESSGLGSSSRQIDKGKVWSVKPLRSLVPVFVSPPSDVPASYLPGQGPPFVYSPPAGPFPPWSAPFYPFCISPQHQQAQQRNIGNAASGSNQNGPSASSYPIHSPIQSTMFRAQAQRQPAFHPNDSYREANGDAPDVVFVEEDGYDNSHDQTIDYTDADPGTVGKRKRKPYKHAKAGEFNSNVHDVNIDAVAENFLSTLNLVTFDAFRRTDGDRESVQYILMTYDLLRRRITQIDNRKGQRPGVKRRPDLRAGTILLNKGIRTNVNKRIGTVSGVEIGDIFFFRMELCLVGLHAPCMAGIDFMNLKAKEDGPLALCIVSSGGYEDNIEDGDTLVYTGQGGNLHDRRFGQQVKDQELERGNLALEKSLSRGNEVRVIRGLKDIAHPTGKVYVYDGLYKIQSSWSEKVNSGVNVFKYKLARLPGQPAAFVIWKLIQQWKRNIGTRTGCIVRDMTSGLENISVCVVNEVDDESGPSQFTYSPSLNYSTLVASPSAFSSCNCRDGCQPGDPRCPCIQKNEGNLSYNSFGVVVNHQSMITECGPACQCPSTCRNRVSQAGFKVQLEVCKTRERGWGLRSWDPIRAGQFICQYAGEVISKDKLEQDDNYVFDASRSFVPMDLMPCNLYASDKIPFPLVISSRRVGNVARFMNHSCSPNVYWQPVLRGNGHECMVHVAFFAIKNIPPMTELAYDYGIVQSREEDYRKQRCLCGSVKCRGFFY